VRLGRGGLERGRCVQGSALTLVQPQLSGTGQSTWVTRGIGREEVDQWHVAML
jgi:hypothetical protein